jgi:hypothetical protein
VEAVEGLTSLSAIGESIRMQSLKRRFAAAPEGTAVLFFID